MTHRVLLAVHLHGVVVVVVAVGRGGVVGSRGGSVHSRTTFLKQNLMTFVLFSVTYLEPEEAERLMAPPPPGLDPLSPATPAAAESGVELAAAPPPATEGASPISTEESSCTKRETNVAKEINRKG